MEEESTLGNNGQFDAVAGSVTQLPQYFDQNSRRQNWSRQIGFTKTSGATQNASIVSEAKT